MSPECIEEYRKRFQEAKAKRVQRTLDLAPRFDSVYREAVDRMDREEQAHGILPGPVHISEEVKARIREQRDDM